MLVVAKVWRRMPWRAFSCQINVASKGDIGWKRRDENGERLQVRAKKVGDRWLFRIRKQRFDDWQDHPTPSLDDWLELLYAVQRRIQRNLIPEIEEEHLVKTILEQFPEATF